MILKEIFKCLVICFLYFYSIKTIATEKNFNINFKLNDVSKQCEMSLEWYTNNQVLKENFYVFLNIKNMQRI